MNAVVFVPYDNVLGSATGVKRVKGAPYYARNHDEPQWGWHFINLHTRRGAGLSNTLRQGGIWLGGISFRLEYESVCESHRIVVQNSPVAFDALKGYCL